MVDGRRCIRGDGQPFSRWGVQPSVPSPAAIRQQARQTNSRQSVTCSLPASVLSKTTQDLLEQVLTQGYRNQLIRLWSWQQAARHTRLKTGAVGIRPMGLPNTMAAAGDAVLAGS
jgi:hypothetical protein